LFTADYRTRDAHEGNGTLGNGTLGNGTLGNGTLKIVEEKC